MIKKIVFNIVQTIYFIKLIRNYKLFVVYFMLCLVSTESLIININYLLI